MVIVDIKFVPKIFASNTAWRRSCPGTLFLATTKAPTTIYIPMPERKSVRPIADARTTRSGLDWEDRQIVDERHEQVSFVDVDCTEASIEGTTFSECYFRGVKFNCARIINSAFVNCTFTQCTFFETRFTDCKLVGSIFERCTYDLMRVDGGNWSHVSLVRANLGRAVIRDVRFHEADFSGAKFNDGVLCNTDLTGSSLQGADFTDCDLRRSDLSALEPGRVVLTGAIITVEQAMTVAILLGLDVRSE